MEILGINFFDPSSWRSILFIGTLFGSLLVANILKSWIPVLKKSLIPNSVLGGLILLVVSAVCYYTTGEYLYDMTVFSKEHSGMDILELITYHCLAIGFIAMTLRPVGKKLTKERSVEILNSGMLTIGTYMLQAICGIAITIVAAHVIEGFASGAGVLLCFGYGQGTGQALNIGKNFDAGVGGGGTYASIGLALAALGFLTASIVGVIYLNYLRRKGRLNPAVEQEAEALGMADVQGKNEMPMNESVDKLSVQAALVLLTYMIAYGFMYLVGNVIFGVESSMIGTVYGFNFLFGVLAAVLVKGVMGFLQKKGVLKREYKNIFLLNRISGFAFDIMIVSGICAIRIDVITTYMGLILLLGVVGAVVTFFYVRGISARLFPANEHEQFLAFFGMLTGTASTGMILLREADPNLTTPVSDNLVYQNFPAIVLALPLLYIANQLTTHPLSLNTTYMVLAMVLVIFAVLNAALFRSRIFKKKGRKAK